MTVSLRLALVLSALLLSSMTGQAPAQEELRMADLSTFPRATLQVIHHDHGRAAQRHSFEVWVADTPARAEQGLMFVRDLPPERGMVFPLSPPRVEAMWMKNTYIELDMLFVGVDGRIARVLEHARPLSLDLLSSQEPVAAVVELRGGTVARLQLRVGDGVTWRKPAD
ncbi:MAG: DUF192 domain-containing protein [Proteobacteria bacterium]|nr:DUF192 domain-containing protein [Pseudomonadota bacterium]